MSRCTIKGCSNSAEISNKCFQHAFDDETWRKIADWKLDDADYGEKLMKSTVAPWVNNIEWERCNEFGKIAYPKYIHYFVIDIDDPCELVIPFESIKNYIPEGASDILMMQVVWHYMQKNIHDYVCYNNAKMGKELLNNNIIKDSDSVSDAQFQDILKENPDYYIETMRKYMTICCANMRKFRRLWPDSTNSVTVSNIVRAYNARKYTLPIIAIDVARLDDSVCAQFKRIPDDADHITTYTSCIFQVIDNYALSIWTNSCWVECKWFLGVPSTTIENMDQESLNETFKFTGERVFEILNIHDISMNNLIDAVEESEFDILTLQHIYGAVQDHPQTHLCCYYSDWLCDKYNIIFEDCYEYSFAKIVDMCFP
jgi:hypothetical protein